jgi:phosphoglycerate dehydrogenase-like enzyme
MMLCLVRRLPDAWRNQSVSCAWNHDALRRRVTTLHGSTVALLGYGNIARRLAALLLPFDVRLLATRRSPVREPPVETLTPEELTARLPVVDHVVSTLPENDATRGFMGDDRFRRMKPGAFFYNVGRGRTVDEDALLRALVSGHLGGAYLDVTGVEPLPKEHPLWTAPRCLVTPHIAGGNADEGLRLVRHFITNLGRFRAGEPLIDRVV